MDIRHELMNIEESEIKASKWIRYFMDELKNLKKDLEEVKKREEILGKSVLKLYGEKEQESTKENR